MKLSKRESRLVSLALLAVMIFIYYLYFLTPKLEEYGKIKEEMRKKQQELGTLQAAEGEIAKLMEDIEEGKREIAKLEDILPSSRRIPDIIVLMETLSQEAGLNLRGITFDISLEDKDKNSKDKNVDEKVQNQEYAEIPFKISVDGTYGQILDFLRSIEETERIYSLKSIIVSREYEAEESSMGADIELSTYAVKHDGKLIDDPGAYGFMKGEYGKENPFKPLPEEAAVYTAPVAGGSKGTTVNVPSDEFIEDIMEHLFEQIFKDLSNPR